MMIPLTHERRVDARLLTEHVLVESACYYREVLTVLRDAEVDGAPELRAYFEEELRGIESEIDRRMLFRKRFGHRRHRPPPPAPGSDRAFAN